MPDATILDTRDHSDAILCGYDGPADPRNDTAGLIIRKATYNSGRSLQITLEGWEGEVSLMGEAEIEQTIKALAGALEGHRRGQTTRARAA